MTEYSHLWLYFLMVFGIIVLPGMDMAFVLASSLAGGRKAGMFAVAGIVFGGICHVAAGALGVGLLFKLVPGLMNAMLIVGAGYIAWIGISLMRGKASEASDAAPPLIAQRSAWATFRQAAFTCLLNPKAYLFMLAIFPQFLRAEYGTAWLQAVALSAITAVTQIAVYGGLALAAGGARGWLRDRPTAGLLIARASGMMLLAGAAVAAGGAIAAR
jgi:threonine/homoserine/homoserine lactone efflux protein